MTVPSTEITRLAAYNVSIENVSYTFVGPDLYGYVTQWPVALSDVAAVATWISVIASTHVVSPDNSIDTITAVTQGEYDAIDPKDASTLYVITG